MTTTCTHPCRAALIGIFTAGAIACAAGPTNPSGSAARLSDVASAGRPAPDAAVCGALTGMEVEHGRVEGAERFVRGEAMAGGATAGAAAAANVCRVRLRLQPTPGSDIEVEVWLPERWNHKLYGIGGGGFDGGLSAGSAPILNGAIERGYAAVATDVGHKPSPTLETWVHEQPEKVVDFGHRANHLAAVAAKQVIAAYYGSPARHAYFLGCSNGGREALMEVTRYPEDYDGVVAGAPARRYVEVLTQFIWHSRIVHGPGGAPGLGSKLNLVHEAVMSACDRLDGVEDGLLENPLRCRFDPAQLRCEAADGPACLTDAEIDALREIHRGPRLGSGQRIASGPALGSEGVPDNWTAWITTPEAATYGEAFYRWMVFDEPEWNLEDFTLDRDYPEARARLAAIINVEETDLRPFTRRGSKLIIYHGWDDPAIPPADTIAYYEAIRRQLGPTADDHVRLFMVPGMMHCAGGPGATQFDMLPHLERWVERGEAPERVLAVKPDSGEPPFSRPLCPWPKTAHYDGAGSIRDAASFTCR